MAHANGRLGPAARRFCWSSPGRPCLAVVERLVPCGQHRVPVDLGADRLVGAHGSIGASAQSRAWQRAEAVRVDPHRRARWNLLRKFSNATVQVSSTISSSEYSDLRRSKSIVAAMRDGSRLTASPLRS